MSQKENHRDKIQKIEREVKISCSVNSPSIRVLENIVADTFYVYVRR